MFTPLFGLQAALAAFTAYYLGSWYAGVQKPAPGGEPEAKAGGFPVNRISRIKTTIDPTSAD